MWPLLKVTAFVLTLMAVLEGCGGAEPAPGLPARPVTERVLLDAPDPAGPTERGVLVKDPKGQIDLLAAGGRLVAWTVRTPAEVIDDEYEGRPPVRLPASTRIVVVDERGGAPLRISGARPWVREMRMLRGPRGAAEPQLAVRSCTTRRLASCRAELLTLTPRAPLKVVARTGGADADAAVDGGLDSGRRLDVAGAKPGVGHATCTAAITVHERGTVRRLPPIPADSDYPRCGKVVGRLITGDFAFVTVLRKDPAHDFEAEIVSGIDLRQGAKARWHHVAAPYRYTPGGSGLQFGPAVSDGALYWEELDEEWVRGYDLERVVLPEAAEPVAPSRTDSCDIAATNTAIYELGNPRCTWGSAEGDGGAEIRRVVRPVFRPIEDE